MSRTLQELEVLVLDCQASGATPQHGDLLELGWARCTGLGLLHEARSHWIVPRTQRRVTSAVRELTGWSERILSDAVAESDAWSALQQELQQFAGHDAQAIPTMIHFARFEQPFLRDLHERLGSGAFPFDIRCLHAIAARLYPDLPRRNIRALAGYLGHSTELVRRASGHVQASAFIWQSLVATLADRGISTLADLDAWLSAPAPKKSRGPRVFPFPAERRRSLPDAPGVYRFLRRNGDVLYVGKATSIKKRIAGHFRRGAHHNERILELLTQVHDITFTMTDSTLEAALLESDEIKRFDPPYNIQLRSYERQAWFVSRSMRDAQAEPDASHSLGPLPSQRSLLSLPALASLLSTADASPGVCALALSVPINQLPDPALFQQGLAQFRAQLTPGSTPMRRLLHTSLTLWLERRRSEPEPAEGSEELAPDEWDLARVLRRLDRNLIQCGLLLRRARWLQLLIDADIAFREADSQEVRLLSLCLGHVCAQEQLPVVNALQTLTPRPMHSRKQRMKAFDAGTYDRMRVIATELCRISSEGGDLAVRFGKHVLVGPRLQRALRLI